MDIKGILAKVGLIGAGVGASAANAMTGGALTPLTNTLMNVISKNLDPTVKQQLDLALEEHKEDLQKAEWDHTEKIATIAQQDLASARSRQAAVKDWIPSLLAIYLTTIITAFMAFLAWMIARNIQVVNSPVFVLLNSVVAAVLGCFLTMIAYYYGSSTGSATKNDLIDRLTAGGKAVGSGQ